jgi:hypothetical protein
LALEFLTRADLDRYLALEFPGHGFPEEFAALVRARTEGSPLFMADLLRYLRDRQVLAQEQGRWTLGQTVPDLRRELPESVRGMLQRKIDQLGEDDRRLLVAASVQGYEFDSAVVARVLERGAADVEDRMDELDRVHAFVQVVREQEFPDRTLTLRYRVVHVLYQNARYASPGPTRRASRSAAGRRAHRSWPAGGRYLPSHDSCHCSSDSVPIATRPVCLENDRRHASMPPTGRPVFETGPHAVRRDNRFDVVAQAEYVGPLSNPYRGDDR